MSKYNRLLTIGLALSVSCQITPLGLTKRRLITDVVEISLPKSWSTSKKRAVFGSCCKVCSFGEYAREISDGQKNQVSVYVTYDPNYHNVFNFSPQFYWKNVKARHRGEAIVTDSSANKQRGMVSIGFLILRDTGNAYYKWTQVGGKHRRVEFILRGDTTASTRSLFQQIQESIHVDSAYIN